MTAVDLEALERRLRQKITPQDLDWCPWCDGRHGEHKEWCDGKCLRDCLAALAVLRQERTRLQGLIETWRRAAEIPWMMRMANDCARELEAVLSGSVVSPSNENKA